MAHERAIEAAARALCTERCACVGDPPCWRVIEKWNPADCAEPSCALQARDAVVAFLRECECSEGIAEAFWKSPGVKSNPDERPGITWSAMRDALIRELEAPDGKA